MSYKLSRLMTRHAAAPRAPRPASAPPRVIEDKTTPCVAPPDLSVWRVVMVGPRCEAAAVTALHQAGFDAWQPRMVVMISSSSVGRKAFVNRPLWPRYILVGQHPDVRTALRDIHNIGAPLIVGRLSGHIVHAVFERETSGEFDCRAVSTAGPTFDPGAPVETCDGLLRGVVRMSDEARTVVLFRLLDADREVVVETVRLRKRA